VAGLARIRYFLAGPATGRASLLDAEEPLLHAHRPAAITSVAGARMGARLGAGTVAGLASLPAGHAYFCVETRCGLLQSDLERILQVGAPVNLGPTAPSARAEDLAEN